jgi:hypothetical protein
MFGIQRVKIVSQNYIIHIILEHMLQFWFLMLQEKLRIHTLKHGMRR